MFSLVSEKDREGLAEQFTYQQTEGGQGESEPRRCCADLETGMDRFIFATGLLFSVVLGPFSGVQIVAGEQETDIYVSGVPCLTLFLCSLLMSVSGKFYRRLVSRLWLTAGLVWLTCGWVVWFRKDFTEKPKEWQIVALVQTIIFAFFGIPILFTDPMIWMTLY